MVCGGTTSQIVSRVSGRDLRVKIDYKDAGVPPTGMIEGIDLVTEGVVTLAKTYEIMQKYMAEGSDMEELFDIFKQDGASRLAKAALGGMHKRALYGGTRSQPPRTRTRTFRSTSASSCAW